MSADERGAGGGALPGRPGRDEREKRIRKLIRKQKLGLFFVTSLAKRRRSFWDRFKVWLFARLVPGRGAAPDFMRDELIEQAPEFSPEELARFERGETRT